MEAPGIRVRCTAVPTLTAPRGFLRWWRYRRYLNAEVSRRQWLGYDVSLTLYEDLREQARARAGY